METPQDQLGPATSPEGEASWGLVLHVDSARRPHVALVRARATFVSGLPAVDRGHGSSGCSS
jgi:hypothetical protein